MDPEVLEYHISNCCCWQDLVNRTRRWGRRGGLCLLVLSKKEGACLPRELLYECLGNYRRLTQRSADAQTENRRKRSERHCTHAAEAVTSFLDRPESQKNMRKTKRGKRRTRVKDFQIYKDFSILGEKKRIKWTVTGKRYISVLKYLFWNVEIRWWLILLKLQCCRQSKAYWL